MLRGTLRRVLILLRKILMVSLIQRESVPGNWTRHLIDRQNYAPQVSLPTHLFYISYAFGTIAFFLVGGGVNVK